jgi:aminoglycoside phosphotransferase (APT) family kinase protein
VASIGLAQGDVVRLADPRASGQREPLLVVEPLIEFMDRHGVGAGEPTFSPLGDGHSNVTISVCRGGEEFVLRRPPRGPLPPSAHDVVREARILSALHGSTRVPKVLAVAEDDGIIGAPFFVMEKVAGHVITDAVPPEIDTPDARRQIAYELIDALIEVHGVEWRHTPLESFGKPTGYPARQVRRFAGLWQLNRTRDIPEVERVERWLAENLPEQRDTTVVHGDFRLGNVMFAAAAPVRLNSIFDWEMATLGDPLADLGYLCMTWAEPGDPSYGIADLGRVTRDPGFPSRDALISRYEDGSGRPATDMRWYSTLALWKTLIFMEGNYKRAASGSTDDPYLAGFGDSVVELARRAEDVALRGA